MPYPGLLHPEPLPPRQATADPYLLRRHSNTVLAQSLWGLWGPLRLVLSLSGSLGCLSPLGTSGRWGLWFSIWFCPCYHLAGAIPLPLDVGYFFFFFWWNLTFSIRQLFNSELFWSSRRRWAQFPLLCHLMPQKNWMPTRNPSCSHLPGTPWAWFWNQDHFCTFC